MVKKRSVFDIDFDPDTEENTTGFPAGNQRAPEAKARNVQGHPLQNRDPVPPTTRRGPMASAIAETSEATAERAGAEAAIRVENDALAHEHVRLKKLGLITDLIETTQVLTSKLTRDRSEAVDPELDELKASIAAVGLSNPIRVEQTSDGYQLIQGYRRLSAFRALAKETGDPRYTRIPAALVPRGEPLADLYRKMVDENLVRKDLSFGEMAQLAISYAQDAGIEASDAVTQLYASALKQKRSYIRQFTRVLENLGDDLRHPEAVPRALGLDLAKLFDAEPALAKPVRAALRAQAGRGAEAEQKILREAIVLTKAPTQPMGRKAVSKTTLRMVRAEGEARVVATDGQVDLRLARDFSAISKARLQKAVEAFLKELDEG